MKRPSLLLKVDITQTFDSVAWPFLLDVLQHLGFTRLGLNWISAKLSTSSTTMLLNGSPETGFALLKASAKAIPYHHCSFS
jgi:hypothetical protein